MNFERHPLSPAQHYHLNLTSDGEVAPDINIAFAIFVSVGGDCAELETLIRLALNSHASLCTIFDEFEGRTWQRFVGGGEIRVDVDPPHGCSPLNNGTQCDPMFTEWYRVRSVGAYDADWVAKVIAKEKRHIFRLDQELPTRVTLIPHNSGGTSIVFCFHHAALDAPSLPTLLATIKKTLSGSPPEHVDYRYFDYAKRKASDYVDRRSKQLEYWLKNLSDENKVCDFSVLERKPVTCDSLEVVVSKPHEQHEDSAFSARMGQSQHLLAFASGLSAINEYGGTYIFTTSNNRPLIDEQDIVGCFYRHVIWNIPNDINNRIADMTKLISRQAIRNYQNIDISLDDIISAFIERRGIFPALNASLQVRDVRNIIDQTDPLQSVLIVPYFLINIEDRIPIHLHVSLDTSQTAFSLTYDPNFIDASQAQSLMNIVAPRP